MRPDEPVRLRAYTPRLRAAAAALVVLAIANLIELAVRIAADTLSAAEVERAPLPLVVRRVLLLSMVPWLLWRIVRALCNGTGTPGDVLVFSTPWGSLQIPRATVGEVRAFRVPVPEPGFEVMAPGGRVDLSAEAGSLLGASWPDADARRRMRNWHRPAIKLGLVPAALTVILFRLHEIAVYGGLMGEAQRFGARRWVHTLAGVALYSFCMLLIAAATLRAVVELAALFTARLPAPWAYRSRIALEAAAAVVYYGGLASLLILRLGL